MTLCGPSLTFQLFSTGSTIWWGSLINIMDLNIFMFVRRTIQVSLTPTFFVGPLIPCFGLLVISPLGFKASKSSLICIWQSHTWYMFPRFTSGTTPAEPFFSCELTLVGLETGIYHAATEAKALLTELCLLSCWLKKLSLKHSMNLNSWLSLFSDLVVPFFQCFKTFVKL